MIQTLFDPKKDIRRTIEKVITFGASQEDRLRSEIAEYEVTEAIDDHIVDLLTKMQIGMESGGPNEVGVWLSGFYGSGKSSLAKYLGFALDDRVTVDGVRFLKHLQDRLRTPQSKALLSKTASSYPAAVVMLDLASEMVAGNTMEDVSTVLYYKVLQWAGYSRNLKVAALERRLQQDGRFDEFRQMVRDELDADWEVYQNDPLVVDSLLPEIAHRLYPELFRTPTSFTTNPADYIRFENDRVIEMLNLLREVSGKRHVLFIIDEVGQYIASRQNLILNLDGLAKNLKNIGDGKIWIMATAQQTLTEDSPRAALNSMELYKLNDRFPIKIDLPSSDIREICTRRLLGKSSAGEARLRTLFAQHGQALRQNTKLEDARFYDAGLDEASFVNLYPFLPAHFDILLHLLGVLAKSTGGIGLRSAIKIVQDVLIEELEHNQPLAEQPIGRLVTAVTLYDALEKDIRRGKESVYKGVDKTRIRFPSSPIHQQVAKTVAVLQTLDNMPITAQNIASLLHSAIDAPSLRAAVDAAVAELTADPHVPFGMHEGGYRFFSEHINDIEQERSQAPVASVERRRTQNEALAACFDPLPSAQLHSTLTVTAGVRTLWGSQSVSIDGEREPIQIQIEFAEPADHDAARTRLLTESMQPAGRSTIYLLAQSSEPAADVAADIVRTKTIVERHRNDAEPEVRDYCRGQEARGDRLKQDLVSMLRLSLAQGSFIFRGQSSAVESLHPDLKEAARKQLATAAQQLFDRYAEAPVRAETNTAELLLRAGNLKAITAKIDPLGLVQIVGGTPSINTHNKAVVSIRDHLDRSGTVEGRRLTDHFSASPFGWSPDTVRYLVAAMLLAGEISLRVGGREITVPGQQAIDALKTNVAFKNVGIALRAGPIDVSTLARAASRLTQLTGETVFPLEHEISKAARKHLPGALSVSAPLAERLNSLRLPGVEDVRALGETIQEMLLADASDAAIRFGSVDSALYDSLVWTAAVDRQLRNGLEATVRELQRHCREIENLPASGFPGALKAELADTLDAVRDRLSNPSFHFASADLSTALTTIQAAVRRTAEAMQAAQQQEIHDARETLRRVPEWSRLEVPQQQELFGRLEGMAVDAPATLDGIRSLTNQDYTLQRTLAELQRQVPILVPKPPIHDGDGVVIREVSLPARITNRTALETAIHDLQTIADETAPYDSLEVRLTLKD